MQDIDKMNFFETASCYQDATVVIAQNSYIWITTILPKVLCTKEVLNLGPAGTKPFCRNNPNAED